MTEQIERDPLAVLEEEINKLHAFVLHVAREAGINTAAAKPDPAQPAPVELPAHWRALSQILRNLADRIVHMTSTDRGHLLNRLNDADWIVDKRGEWMCIVCDRLELEHDFDCPVKALETLMKVHGGVL